MARKRRTAEEVDRILDQPDLAVSGSYGWEVKANTRWAGIEIPVRGLAVAGSVLRLVVSINLIDSSRRNYLLLLDDERIRALCINGSHENRRCGTGSWRGQTHKHRWTTECRDRYAYTPVDITADTHQGELEQFCKECHIECRVTLAPIPAVLGELFDDDV